MTSVDSASLRHTYLYPLLGFAFGAGWLFWHAHYHWGSESYYNFGWAIPFLGLYLLYRRLQHARFSPEEGSTSRRETWKVLLPVFLLFASWLTLTRLFNEANPFWRVPLWAYGSALVALYCFLVLRFSGRRGLAHFYFPILFCLVALPWPWRLEQALIQSLTQWVTGLTVGFLNLAGYPAEAMGNTIRIGEDQLGVDEACSGIRSLQALVMISLFLGEYFFFRIPSRLLLVAGAILLVLVFNGIRAITLAWVTVEGDPEAFQFWHDTMGYVSFIASSILLFLLGDRLEAAHLKKRDGEGKPQLPIRKLRSPGAPSLILAVGMTFLVPELAVEGYYRFQESKSAPLPELEVTWPDSGSPRFSLDEIPEPVETALQYDFGTRAVALWSNGLQAFITYYGYTGEDRMASVSSFGHSPTICVTAVGGRLKEKKAPLEVSLYGESWWLNHYEFVFEEGPFVQPMQVFWLVWEPQQMGVQAEELGSLTWNSQWELVKNGRRNFARQVLLVQFVGRHSPLEMRRRVEDLLEKIVLD